MPKANCHEYCRYSRYCHKTGEAGLDPDDCPTAWRCEKIEWDVFLDKCAEPIEEPEDPDDWEE